MNPAPEIPALPPSIAAPPPLPAAARPAWNGWWTLLWAFALMMAWQTAQTIGLAGYLAATWDKADFREFMKDPMSLMQNADALWFASALGALAVCPLCWLVGRFKSGWGGWDYMGNAKVRWWPPVLWTLGIVAFGMGFNLIAPAIGIDESPQVMVDMALNTNHIWLMIAAVAIGAPLVEEFMFRGVLFRGWRHSRMGLWGTIFVTSAIWAVLHVQYSFAIVFYIFLMGIVLAYARERTGNIWVPVAMHALNNSLAAIELVRATAV
ncbi:CPBP family intramembrane glutamic endopeptidase [Haloferula helveola]|uniref:CPBP family intramembrane glutamic endopeptidase n=1 Tax=Haloferula helveola TaxID=490095 RepID=UPI0030B1138C